MQYDLAIIGAGWAGFNAARQAQALGLKVALIEKDKVGGTCLNRGCIPTKALIQSAKIYNLSKKSANFGIEISGLKVNFSQIQARKDKIIEQLRQGMEFLLKGVDVIRGEAKILSNNVLEVGVQKIEAKNILIATGSESIELNNFKFDGQKILSSDDIINLKEVPQSLLIVGGGVIGCEFASLFSIFGTAVTVVEKLPQLLPGEDSDVAKKLESIFRKRGIKVHTNTDASGFDLNNFSRGLVCVGRRAKEKISVDEYLRTPQPNIYAAGDCTGKTMLAHFAAYQGEVAARNIAHPDKLEKCDNTSIPNCIFTYPEIASIGIKEADAVSQGIDIKINKFDFLGSGMARILDETEGFVKIVSDKKTQKIIGASIIGPAATELIGTVNLAISAGINIATIRNTIFAHPTLSESIYEAIKRD